MADQPTRTGDERCAMLCDKPAEFYATATTSVPMEPRMPLCLSHVGKYGQLAVEVAAVSGQLQYQTVRIELEPVALARVIDRLSS